LADTATDAVVSLAKIVAGAAVAGPFGALVGGIASVAEAAASDPSSLDVPRPLPAEPLVDKLPAETGPNATAVGRAIVPEGMVLPADIQALETLLPLRGASPGAAVVASLRTTGRRGLRRALGYARAGRQDGPPVRHAVPFPSHVFPRILSDNFALISLERPECGTTTRTSEIGALDGSLIASFGRAIKRIRLRREPCASHGSNGQTEGHITLDPLRARLIVPA
jgi:hypothetical protein